MRTRCGGDEARLPRILPSRADRSVRNRESARTAAGVTLNGPKLIGILTQHIYPRVYKKQVGPKSQPQPPMAETIRLHASFFSARTPNSSVTPCVFEYVILHLTNAFPAPLAPTTNPASCSVWTDVDAGSSVPPSACILRISMMESQAAMEKWL